MKRDGPAPHIKGRVEKAGTCDDYKLALQQSFKDFDGKLFIEWGKGARSWVQRADRQDKRVTELRKEFKEPDFPAFCISGSHCQGSTDCQKLGLPVLQSSRGIYLLTCPKTKEQYVGAAYGAESFWGRWQSYIKTGHGGNVGLKSRYPSDYSPAALPLPIASIESRSLWAERRASARGAR